MDVDVRGFIADRIGSVARLVDGGNSRSYPRLNALQEQVSSNVFNGTQQGGVEGSYYTFANEGTRNTGVTLTAATGASYSATQAILVIYNSNPAGGPCFILDFFQIAYDAVNTAGVGGYFYFAMDAGNRYASGGTTGMTGFNSYGQTPSGITVSTGAITATAATAAARDLGKLVYINGVGAATPTILLTTKFGCQEMPTGSQAIPATTAQNVTYFCPAPVVVTPGNSFVINEFQTSRNAAGTGEFFVGGWLR